MSKKKTIESVTVFHTWGGEGGGTPLRSHLLGDFFSGIKTIFLETSGKIQFNEDDPYHYDHYQDPLDDTGHPPSMGRFLTTIFQFTPQVLYILRNFRQNPVQ